MDGYFEILDNGREYSNFNYSIRYVINLTVPLCVLETLINRSINRKKFLSLVVKEMNLARFLLLGCDYFYCDCVAMMHPKESKYRVQIPADILSRDNRVAETLAVVYMVTLEVPTSSC